MVPGGDRRTQSESHSASVTASYSTNTTGRPTSSSEFFQIVILHDWLLYLPIRHSISLSNNFLAIDDRRTSRRGSSSHIQPLLTKPPSTDSLNINSGSLGDSSSVPPLSPGKIYLSIITLFSSNYLITEVLLIFPAIQFSTQFFHVISKLWYCQ